MVRVRNRGLRWIMCRRGSRRHMIRYLSNHSKICKQCNNLIYINIYALEHNKYDFSLVTMPTTVVQGSAKRRGLGCVNSLPGSAWLQLSRQPRLFADLCTVNMEDKEAISEWQNTSCPLSNFTVEKIVPFPNDVDGELFPHLLWTILHLRQRQSNFCAKVPRTTSQCDLQYLD